MNENTETLYFYGCIPCKVREIAVESLIDNIELCGEPVEFDDKYTLPHLSRIHKLLRGVVPKYTKEKILCFIKV